MEYIIPLSEYEEIFLESFDLGDYNTTESLIDFFESRDLLLKVDEVIDRSLRWVTPIFEYYKVGDRYFCFSWAKGNTEYQENEYYDLTEMNPPRTITKIVYEWDTKDK